VSREASLATRAPVTRHIRTLGETDHPPGRLRPERPSDECRDGSWMEPARLTVQIDERRMAYAVRLVWKGDKVTHAPEKDTPGRLKSRRNSLERRQRCNVDPEHRCQTARRDSPLPAASATCLGNCNRLGRLQVAAPARRAFRAPDGNGPRCPVLSAGVLYRRPSTINYRPDLPATVREDVLSVAAERGARARDAPPEAQGNKPLTSIASPTLSSATATAPRLGVTFRSRDRARLRRRRYRHDAPRRSATRSPSMRSPDGSEPTRSKKP